MVTVLLEVVLQQPGARTARRLASEVAVAAAHDRLPAGSALGQREAERSVVHWLATANTALHATVVRGAERGRGGACYVPRWAECSACKEKGGAMARIRGG